MNCQCFDVEIRTFFHNAIFCQNQYCLCNFNAHSQHNHDHDHDMFVCIVFLLIFTPGILKCFIPNILDIFVWWSFFLRISPSSRSPPGCVKPSPAHTKNIWHWPQVSSPKQTTAPWSGVRSKNKDALKILSHPRPSSPGGPPVFLKKYLNKIMLILIIPNNSS